MATADAEVKGQADTGRPAAGRLPALEEEEPAHRRWLGLLLAAGVALVLGAAVWTIPREHAPLPAVAREALRVALPTWHTLEPVNEVVYGSRGFDTFGETFLLLAAVVGVALVTRGREPRRGFIGEELAGAREQREDDRALEQGPEERQAEAAESGEEGHGRGPATPDDEPPGTPAPERSEGMTVVVRGAVRVVSPVLAVAGLYLAAWGYSPGGGFPAGAVIVGVVLLAYASLGYRRIERAIRPGILEPIEMAGALAIVVVGVLGLVLEGSFSANFLPLGQVQTIPSGGILQVFSGSELVEVATGLTIAIFGLLGMEHEWSDDETGEGGDR